MKQFRKVQSKFFTNLVLQDVELRKSWELDEEESRLAGYKR